MTITVDQVSLKLGTRPVLSAVSCAFAPGRVTAIIGPNGAGKTSFIRLVAGLIAPSAGRITLNGADVRRIDRTERARRIGYLPQASQPHWNVTARALISLGRLPHRSSPATDDAAISRAMERTTTGHLADRSIDQLSGGERARVQLARVIAGNPNWILADEPLANLDPPHARDVLRLCRAAADEGSGVLLVLHQLSAAADIADDVILMRGGGIIAAGARDDVLTADRLEAAFAMPFDVFERAGKRIIMPLSDSAR
jgi:iron complex transport system ATP-binding protein